MSDVLEIPVEQDGDVVRAFRKHWNITLADLSHLSGMSNEMISKFERGERRLSAKAWQSVSDAVREIQETITPDVATLIRKRCNVANFIERARQDARGEAPISMNIAQYIEMKRRERMAGVRLTEEQAARIREKVNRALKDGLPRDEEEELDSYIIEKYARSTGREIAFIASLWNDPAKHEELNALLRECYERWIERLEHAQSQVHDPVLSEIIQSFRNEIAELEQRNARLERRLAEEE